MMDCSRPARLSPDLCCWQSPRPRLAPSLGSSKSSISSSASPAGKSAGAQGKTSTQGKTASASVAVYRACLAKHGLQLPSVSGRRSGLKRLRSGSSSSKYKAALSACASLKPKTRFGGFLTGPGTSGGFSSSAQHKAFKDCLKVNGLSLSELRPASGKAAAISSKEHKIINECLSLVHKSSASPTTTVKGS